MGKDLDAGAAVGVFRPLEGGEVLGNVPVWLVSDISDQLDQVDARPDRVRRWRLGLTLSAVPASVLLGDIDPRDARILLLDPPPILLDCVLVKPGAQDEFVIGAYGALSVSYDLDHADAAERPTPLRIDEGGVRLERGVGNSRRVLRLLPRRPEAEEIDVALELPRWRDVGEVVGRHGDVRREATKPMMLRVGDKVQELRKQHRV